MPTIRIIEQLVLKTILKVSTIFGLGGHLGHVTKTVRINLCPNFPKRFDVKFGLDWPNGFRVEDV